jgi:putative ABC transport system substrate-binding protein
MKRRDLFALLGGAVITWPLVARAEQPKVPTVGVLVIPDYQLPLFRQGLRDLGYVEGQTIRLEIRSANGDLQRLPELAAELVRLKVDVLVAVFTPAVLAAQHATSETPIVMLGVGDPVGMGIVASLARPGGNITGRGASPLDRRQRTSNCSKRRCRPYVALPLYAMRRTRRRF